MNWLARNMRLIFFLLATAVLLFLFAPSVFADENNCRQGHEQCGHNDNDGSVSNVEANADGTGYGGEGGAGGNAEITGGNGGGANVSTKSENTSLVLSGARDTADCFTKIGIGAEGFGVFWSRSDSFCKKVRLIAQKIDEGNYAAAARLECTLPSWEEVFGHKKVRNKNGTYTDGYQQCLDDLMSDELIAQAVQQEEYQETVEQVEYQFSQQTSQIAEQEAEIDRLKREAAALRKKEKADAVRRAAVRAKYAQKAEEQESNNET